MDGSADPDPLSGSTMASHVGALMLGHVGLAEMFAANDAEDFVRRACIGKHILKNCRKFVWNCASALQSRLGGNLRWWWRQAWCVPGASCGNAGVKVCRLNHSKYHDRMPDTFTAGLTSGMHA
jgi:hypothetical protein